MRIDQKLYVHFRLIRGNLSCEFRSEILDIDIDIDLIRLWRPIRPILCRSIHVSQIRAYSLAARGGNLAKIPPNQVIADFGRGSSVESESE